VWLLEMQWWRMAVMVGDKGRRRQAMGGSVNGVRVDREDDHTVWGSPAFIERDQFVYYVTMERELGNPGDWSSFRVGLVDALTVAWGLGTVWLDLDRPAQLERIARRRQAAFGIVDQVRTGHDPLTDWDGFFDALWDARGPLCHDD
jgi:hypothetical protein